MNRKQRRSEGRQGIPPAAVQSFNLANALDQQGRLVEAGDSYRAALRVFPSFVEAMVNLGAVLRRLGRPTEAEEQYRRALALRPSMFETHCNYGNLLLELGRPREAEAALRHACTLKPDVAEAFFNLGIALLAQARNADAALAFGRATGLRPNFAAAHCRQGTALLQARRPSEAAAAFARAIALDDAMVQAHNGLAGALQVQGKYRAARAALVTVWERTGNAMMLAKAATCLPVIPGSRDEIEEVRRHFLTEVTALTERAPAIADSFAQGGETNFYLAYHGLDNLALQQAAAAFHLASCPLLAFAAPHCAQPPQTEGRRLRIGFVSAYFHSHTIGRLNQGLIENLSRERFEVTLFVVAHAPDPLRDSLIRAAEAVVELRQDLASAQRQIAAKELDILYYTDIGMSPFFYYLAFARLAPVQCVTWGHPDTTGIPALDYFLSCDAMEPEGAEAHYSETLVRLPGPTVHYRPPTRDPAAKGRAALGLPGVGTLYLCPQNLFKFHPDFDDVLAAIFRRDPAGHLVLIKDIDPHVDAALTERLKAVDPALPARILWLARLSAGDFVALLAACDVMLDPLHYSGGNTSLEALAMGTPIVTWPGAFMRGRHTFGFYKLMGMLDCVAATHAEYVDIALRLGTDPAWRAEMRERILAANGVLWEDAATVAAVEEFLVGALHRRHGFPPSREHGER